MPKRTEPPKKRTAPKKAAPKKPVEGRRKWPRRIGVACLALLAIVIADWNLYPRYALVGGRTHDQGENGIWLRYTWYFGERKPDEVPALARRLKAHGIRDAFFHVRFIRKDGTLAYRHLDRARTLNAALTKEAPAIRSIAWIYAGNPQGTGDVDLANETVRAAMVREAAWLVRDCGFEGVQWDYEICPDGDPSLLKLLEETRAALPPGTFLGVSTPIAYSWPLSGFGWSREYFGEVAKRCDGIATMTYDTGMLMPRAYVGLVGSTTENITKWVADANPDCGVLIGLPTYEEGFFSHNPNAENLRLAMKGVREATPDVRSFAGIALFADYTMDEQEWEFLKRWWVARH
ncbi:MAG: hypothetical protein ACO1SV_04370 [Fimbriimonas sp.]